MLQGEAVHIKLCISIEILSMLCSMNVRGRYLIGGLMYGYFTNVARERVKVGHVVTAPYKCMEIWSFNFMAMYLISQFS